MLGRAMHLLPADWSDGAKLAVVAGVIAVCFAVPVILMLSAFGRKRTPAVPAAKAVRAPVAAVAAPLKAAARTPNLDPEEWVSGNVVHFDRQRAVGLIRCDRVKGYVRFEAADFRRAPRVGEAVRFKGRHGARRKPVAYVVERLPAASRTG